MMTPSKSNAKSKNSKSEHDRNAENNLEDNVTELSEIEQLEDSSAEIGQKKTKYLKNDQLKNYIPQIPEIEEENEKKKKVIENSDLLKMAWALGNSMTNPAFAMENSDKLMEYGKKVMEDKGKLQEVAEKRQILEKDQPPNSSMPKP